jgi:hypothetical protein
VLRGLSILALLAHGAGLGHNLLERHELCHEHGELVHAGEAHAHADAAGSTRLDDAQPLDALRAGDEGESHGHEHCALAGSRSQLTLGASASTGLHDHGVAQPVAAPAYLALRDGAALHRLAPKQSPPA